MEPEQNRIKELRKTRKISGTEVAKKLSISPQYFYDIEKGERRLSAEIASKLADIFDVSSDYLLGKTDDPSPALSQIDRSIYFFFNLISKHPNKHKIETELDYRLDEAFARFDVSVNGIDLTKGNKYEQLANKISKLQDAEHFKLFLLNELKEFAVDLHLFDNEFQPDISLLDPVSIDPNQIKVPILGSISAGQPIDRIEYIEGYELVDSETLRGRNAYCLKVKGDSMVGDGIYNGDIVVVVKQAEVTSTDIAVVAVNGHEATLKRVRCQGEMCMLMPSNPALQPSLVPAKDVHILGKVIQSRRNFE
ncbi:helix-turn-helix domain-containing protein [Cytobacillus oceanisediminis]|uniref:helix-turn-helix domain-containing protein n=1 Tax=Cytobacillus oceanisediminis TaxID=665099 RepID=UPI00207ABCAA|nr:LexA family transcriptional regulator [Cytobacillus oceanisediminis]USK46311.1 helix-turn-helix domain-containing protein [Cytobacillus oceanisediminis]